MKGFVLVIFLLVQLQMSGQIKEMPLGKKIFSCSFSLQDVYTWPRYNRKDSSAFIDHGIYEFKSSYKYRRTYIIPKASPKLDTFQVEASIMPDYNKKDKGCAGVVFGYHGPSGFEYILEINAKRQYRILYHDLHGDFFLTRKGKWQGWVSTNLLGPGFNLIDINVVGKRISVFINGQEVFYSVDYDTDIEQGENGLVVLGNYTGYCKYFAVSDLRGVYPQHK